TGCDGRHADQQIRGAVVLPHGTGKTVRVLVFARDAKAEEAKAAGAEYVGAEELIPKIQNEGWLDFDVVVATTSKSSHPSFWIFGISSSAPTYSAPAAFASSAFASLANTNTRTVFPVP